MRKQVKKDERKLSINLYPHLYDRLAQLSDEFKQPVGELIREALTSYLPAFAKKKRKERLENRKPL